MNKKKKSQNPKKGIKVDKEVLLNKYKSIKKPIYDDLVLIVVGGEYGVITTYLRDNFNYSGMIIIEPHPHFFTDSVARKNYDVITKKNSNIKYIKSDQIKENSNNLLMLMSDLKAISKGIHIIYNPFYLENYQKEMRIEKQRLDLFLANLKTHQKGLSHEIVKNARKGLNIDENALKERFHLDSDIDMNSLFEKNSIDTGDGSFIVLIGGEYGFFLEHLMKNKVINNIFIIEPDNEFLDDEKANQFYERLTLGNGRHILKRYFFNEEKNEELDFFKDAKSKMTFVNNAKIIIHPFYKKHEKLVQTVKKVTKHLKSTVFAKGNSMGDELYGMTNTMYNLSSLKKVKKFKKHQFDTVISVAAGPSLDDHMDELKELSKRFPVIVVEVAANKLLQEGIFPDIICTQERTFKVTQIMNNLHPELKEKGILVAPNLTHPYNLKTMEHVVLFSQSKKSPQEGYLQQTVYSILSDYDLSIYAGEVNILTAMQFKPQNILLFGHDLAFTEEKKYAENIDTEMQATESEAIQEIGNRGQPVYLTYLFEKFRHNTEVLLNNISNEHNTQFLTFSDGAKVNLVKNAESADYENLLKQPLQKPDVLTLIEPLNYEYKTVLEFLEMEISFIEKQLDFLHQMEELPDITINAKFASLFLQTPTLGNTSAHHLTDDFLSKYMYIQDEMYIWIKEHKEELLSIYQMMKGVLTRARSLVTGEKKLPTAKSSVKDLFEYNLFAVIRNEAYDIEGNIKKDIPKDMLKYILLSFFYSFQSINYIDMAKIMGQLEPYIESDKEAAIIYNEALNRELHTYERKWQEIKDKDLKEKKFYRYQVASFNYKAGNINRVISFLKSFDDLGYPEKIILADALADNDEYQEAFQLYIESLKDKYTQRQIINALSTLIVAEKYAEGVLFRFLFFESVYTNQVFQMNSKLLDERIKQLETVTGNLLPIDERDTSKLTPFRLEIHELSEKEADEIMNLFSKEIKQPVYKVPNEFQTYYLKENDFPLLSYFKLIKDLKQ